ncbi:MAG TPA: hypothetical protein VHL34_19320 [Rhizomicrobium sp.]|jgi:hypothetical protein|nr:hypothetical protein [Rhizomicrobium sp.]
MRFIVAAIAGILLCSAAEAADMSVDQIVAGIRQWTVVKQKDGVTYYISPEDTRDNSPDKTFHTAEIFDEVYEDKDFGIPPNWGYVITRTYNCANQTMTTGESTTLYLSGMRTTRDTGSPVARSEIRADEGVKYFEHACGT